MKPSDDLYIRVLKYCRDNIETPVTPDAVVKYLNDTYGYEFRKYIEHTELSEIFEFTLGYRNLGNTTPYPMKGEAYFKLLEYEELSEARKNAREARWLSIAAIVIALLVGGMELFRNN